MTLPLSYNLRNLVVRRTTTILTALGIGLTVAVLIAVLALVEGLRISLQATAHPLQVVVMRKGSTAELVSTLSRSAFQEIKVQPGIARTAAGEPMASLEMVTVITLKSPELPEGINITLRGLTPVGILMREQVRLREGRQFSPGHREVVVGRSIAERYPAARLGGHLKFGRGEWDVVGVMDGGRSAANSEIFADLNQVSADYNRADLLSSALVRATDPVSMQALMNDLESTRSLNVTAESEKAYFDEQTMSALPIRIVGMFIAIIMAAGSGFAAMNTMYAAVARRSAEIGTLRVLGFSRGRILLSFLIESLILSGIGGVLGCVIALPLNSLRAGIGNWVTFSEIVFELRVTPAVAGAGLLFALLMGAVGGLLPARAAARKEILAALRGR